ncbi:MAG TPA: OmpA family protein, partial [Leucothrix sp.]|nr:OmpA family protein [Leucothrix sp.]
ELTALQSAYKMRNDENVVLKAKLAELENSLKQSAGTVDACNTEVIDLKGSCKKLGAANDDLAKKLADAIADTDKDGILDHSDKCPFTTAGTTVNAMGCADDSDKDGVVDADDKCPTSPVGSHVNAEGCPKVKDSDNDGVADGTDMCPTSLAGATVNEFGCAPTANITLDGVNFLTGSSSLTAQSLPILDAAAATIMKNPSIKLEISGHTDNQGNSALNKNLSQRRANTVMIHLIKRGVEAGKLVAKGYGDQNPVADNATDAGRKSNRRVELKIRK